VIGLLCLIGITRYVDLDLFLRHPHRHIILLVIVAPITVDSMIESDTIISRSTLDFATQRIFVSPPPTPLLSAQMPGFVSWYLLTIRKIDIFIVIDIWNDWIMGRRASVTNRASTNKIESAGITGEKMFY